MIRTAPKKWGWSELLCMLRELLTHYLDSPVSSERSLWASCFWCSCLESDSGTSRNLWSWRRQTPATAEGQMPFPVASSPWPAQSPGHIQLANLIEMNRMYNTHKKRTPQILVPPTSKLSSSFIPSCHFSNSFSQLSTVLRGQTTRAVVNFSFSQSSKVWRNATTYRTHMELQVNYYKSKFKLT